MKLSEKMDLPPISSADFFFANSNLDVNFNRDEPRLGLDSSGSILG